jgi:short-subunit dehydrogenase
MNIDRRSLGLPTVLLGLAALAFSIVRRRRESEAVRNLRGKVVLITGGSRGLGFAIAREAASIGARLVLTARDAEELSRAKARLVSIGVATPQDVMVQAADASVPGDIQDLIAAAMAYFGRIDVVVNNAGIIMVGPVESQTLDSFRMAMNINFFGSLHTTLAVLPQMLARGEGSIVNIASIGGKVAFPHLLPYVASKFALVGWSQGLRAELVRKGIQVVTVTPGIMCTGSHIQARFTGNADQEYRWFAGAASFPGTATNATKAARKVLIALAKGKAEISIGLQAIVAARLANISTELTARFLSLADLFLPGDPVAVGLGDVPDARGFFDADHSVGGVAFRGGLNPVLERFGGMAIKQYNQEPPTE